MTLRFWSFALFFCLITCIGWAQPNASPSALNRAYQQASTDGQRLESLKELFAYYRPVNLDSAQLIVNLALPIARRSKDHKAEVFFLSKQGTLYRMNKANPRTGLSSYLEALRLAESHQDSAAYSEIYYGIGRIQDDQDNREEAKKAFLNAIRWAQTGAMLYNALESLAVHYANHNDLKQSEKYFKEAEKLVNRSPNLDNYQLRLKSNMAEFYVKYKRDTTQSLYYYRQSIRYAVTNPQTDLERYLVESVALAQVFLNLKDYENCIALCRKIIGYKNNPKYNIQKTVSQSYQYMFRAFKALGDYKTAALYADSAIVLKDNLDRLVNSDNIKKETYKLEAAFNLERKQKEVELLAQKQKLQQIWMSAAVVIVLLLSVFSWILYQNRQRLTKQKSELTQLNATKDKLFAILSHDLRSPVANLQSKVALTNWGALSQQQFVQAAQQLATDIRYVSATLDNLLHWALSQMKGLTPHPTRVALASVVQEQVQGLQLNASTKSITVHTAIAPDAYLLADQTHLAIMIRNLLHNALKFTEPGGEISIGYAVQAGLGQITIRDTGIGMEPERLVQLFRLDKQTARAGTAQEAGTGLGLVLVQELVEANGGQVTVESAPGQGSTFSLTFAQPVKPARKLTGALN